MKSKTSKNGKKSYEKIVQKSKVVSLIFLPFIVGILFGYIIGNYNKKTITKAKILSPKIKVHQIHESGHKLTNPLLDSEITGPYSKELINFEHKIEKLIANITKNNRASVVGVYFRDLNNGPWFGVNEREKFSPASLLKVPILIACLKQAESDPNFLTKKIKYEKEIVDMKQTFMSFSKLEVGKSYTIDELLFRMIAYSDNIAKDLLLENLNTNILDNVYSDLGMYTPYIRPYDDFISVKEYSSFFRVLFNSSYLNRDMSEKALEYLTKTTFDRGIVAGVPKNITIAHKFGERTNTKTGEVQLHDCGIIYYPNYPYILCVMTKGTNYYKLENVIKDISSLAYEEVNTQKKSISQDNTKTIF